MAGREVYFETRRYGNMVRLTAIDSATGVEATITGDIRAGQHALRQLALRKLEYSLAKSGEPALKSR